MSARVPSHGRKGQSSCGRRGFQEGHPDKTFIGRIERGFDFLGYHFGPDGISVAKKTVENFVARAIWLYEQERREPFGSPRFGSYVRRWIGWAAAGFEGQAYVTVSQTSTR